MARQLEYEPISLVIIAHNEAQTIEKEILSLYHKIVMRIPGSEFIVAEDGSTDGTREIIRRLVREISLIHLSSRARRGYAKALVQAVCSARNEYVFLTDSGLKYDPEDFWKLHRERKSYELIVGRRTKRRDQVYRRFLTHAYNLFLRTYLGLPNVHDADAGFRLFGRSVMEKVFKRGLFFDQLICSEITARTILAGLRYCEVDVSYHSREGVSRGLPPRKIPMVVVGTLCNVRRLKRLTRLNMDAHRLTGPYSTDRTILSTHTQASCLEPQTPMEACEKMYHSTP